MSDKRNATGAAGSEIFNHLIFVKQRMICIFHTLLLGRAHISWITYNIPVKLLQHFFYFFLIDLALYNMTGVYYNSFTIYTDIFGKGCEKYEN
ncbi:Hypothetical protein EUBREC_0034 [Agathobacter rectalis ATCC 33656]|uniref:Uncharacterized protein n=1 Tax=Agathobacter rectalis (strain ATCC 33656 / DSM 3377 / JCM 17463 / KCTC 5835 / VPI 0990) TaxID=515619 RepID=C4Z9J1_AGARV|nr:Hypothetical protein EUBREC_0034 [Agathobacter rectalis ATCC 33656]